MPAERPQFRSVSRVPEPDGFVASAGGQASAIGRKDHAGDVVARVTAQNVPELAGGRVPNPGGEIVAGRSDPASIRRERHPDNPASVPLEPTQFAPTLKIPKAYTYFHPTDVKSQQAPK